jgi:hypothetical protein
MFIPATDPLLDSHRESLLTITYNSLDPWSRYLMKMPLRSLRALGYISHEAYLICDRAEQQAKYGGVLGGYCPGDVLRWADDGGCYRE